MDQIAEKILAGEPLDDITVIDVHGHALHDHNNWYCKDITDQGGLIQQMDRVGVDIVWASSFLSILNECPAGNALMKKTVENSNGRIKGYFVVNGNFPDELEEEVYRYKDIPDFLGAKFYSGIGLDGPNPNIALDHPGLDKVYELAAKYNFALLVHTWGSDGYPAAPNRFRRALERYPELKLIVGHSGGDWYGHQETLSLMRDYPNVYWDVTGTEFGHIWIKDLVRLADPKRILFGSDVGSMDNRHYIGAVGLADIDVEIKKDILGRNAMRLMESLAHQ